MRTIKLVLVMLFSIAFAACNPGDKKPDTPTGVTATAGNGQVTINWNAVSGATSYNLYMATQTGVTKNNYSTLTGGMAHPAVTSPYVHPGLTNGTAYYFIVTAVNASGESVESAQVSATPSTTAGFDGTYTASLSGTMTDGTPETASFTITVVNGVITGAVSQSSISGMVSSSGAITMTANGDGSGSSCGVVTFIGQIAITASGGATATGTYSKLQTGGVSCTAPPSTGTWTATRATTATGVSVFNGVYTGTSLSTDGGTGAIVFTVTNGVVANAGAGHAGGTSGTGSGSGTVSESGVVTIMTTSSAGCAYTFTGQFTITASGGATATGMFSIPATSTCAAYSGTWTATPDVPVPAQ